MAEKDGLEGRDYSAQIPEDLLIDILARLPVKSLIKFTCVCKSWLSLIKSPEFADKQYETRTKVLLKAPYDCDNLVLRYGGNFVSRVEVLFLDYATLDVSTVFQCKPVEDHYDYYNDCSLYGPCKGIFCVDINIDIEEPALLLWNPSTREVFRPATPKSKLGSCLGFVFRPPTPVSNLGYLGFGFDDNTNDFKIVTFKGHKGFPRRVKVYSLTRNTWRDVKDYDYGSCKEFSLSSCTRSTPSNGRMCNWLGYDKTCGRRFLLSFDLVDEVFIETPIPNNITKDCCDLVQQLYHHTYPALFAYRVVTRIGRDRVPCVDVWVLNEYGPGGSWTQHLSVTLPDQINVPEPSGISKDEGMVLRRFNDKLVYYEPVNQQIKHLDVAAREVVGYTESLFSIKSYCQQLRGSNDYDAEMPYCFREVDSHSCFDYTSCLY